METIATGGSLLSPGTRYEAADSSERPAVGRARRVVPSKSSILSPTRQIQKRRAPIWEFATREWTCASSNGELTVEVAQRAAVEHTGRGPPSRSLDCRSLPPSIVVLVIPRISSRHGRQTDGARPATMSTANTDAVGPTRLVEGLEFK